MRGPAWKLVARRNEVTPLRFGKEFNSHGRFEGGGSGGAPPLRGGAREGGAAQNRQRRRARRRRSPPPPTTGPNTATGRPTPPVERMSPIPAGIAQRAASQGCPEGKFRLHPLDSQGSASHVRGTSRRLARRTKSLPSGCTRQLPPTCTRPHRQWVPADRLGNQPVRKGFLHLSAGAVRLRLHGDGQQEEGADDFHWGHFASNVPPVAFRFPFSVANRRPLGGYAVPQMPAAGGGGYGPERTRPEAVRENLGGAVHVRAFAVFVHIHVEHETMDAAGYYADGFSLLQMCLNLGVRGPNRLPFLGNRRLVHAAQNEMGWVCCWRFGGDVAIYGGCHEITPSHGASRPIGRSSRRP